MCCEFDELTMERHELRRREQIVKRDASSQLFKPAMVLRFDRSSLFDAGYLGVSKVRHARQTSAHFDGERIEGLFAGAQSSRVNEKGSHHGVA